MEKRQVVAVTGIVVPLILGVLCLSLLAGLISGCTSSGLAQATVKKEIRWQDKEDSLSAYVEAQYYVEDQLKSPSTAKFGACGTTSTTKYCTKYLGDQRYRVATYVDAQNGFGAMIRTHFICVLEQTAKDYFELESLDFY